MKPIYVSRKNLLICPSCSHHIQMFAIWQETTCPFCNYSFKNKEVDDSSKRHRVRHKGKILLASLFGIALSACVSISSPNQSEPATEPSAEANSPKETIQERPVEKPIPMDEVPPTIDPYGAPPREYPPDGG